MWGIFGTVPTQMYIKILKKMFQEKWENEYLRVKNARASRARLRALDTSQYWLASLTWLHFATSAKSQEQFLAPPTKSWICYWKHHKFLTKMTISIISEPLKSMGRNFLGILCWKICKYLRHLSIHFKKLLHSLKVLCSGILYQIIFKCKYARN